MPTFVLKTVISAESHFILCEAIIPCVLGSPGRSTLVKVGSSSSVCSRWQARTVLPYCILEETTDEYNRRKETSDDLEPKTKDWTAPYALTRAATVERHDAYSVQVAIELGGYGYVTNWVSDLLTDDEKQSLVRYKDPSYYGMKYDGGQFIKEFFEGMKQSTCHMMFVYGMQDPWTGGQIPNDNMGENSRKLYIQHPTNRRSDAGLHNDYIDQWNFSETN